jgi:hypothetical protein
MSGKPRLTPERRWIIGSDCETRWDAKMLYDRLVVLPGGKWKVDAIKRPKGKQGKSIRARVIWEVAELHDETRRMVTSCWVEYRKTTRALRKELQKNLPNPVGKGQRIRPTWPWPTPFWAKQPVSFLAPGLLGSPPADWRKQKGFFQKQKQPIRRTELSKLVADYKARGGKIRKIRP